MSRPKKDEYTFDVKLLAVVRVKATSEENAREMVHDAFEAADANFGSWPNGKPILAEACSEGAADLIEINGDAI